MKKQILEAIEKGVKSGLLESGFNFSLDDLDHMEDYGLKKKKLDRQFFKDEFDHQQEQYNIQKALQNFNENIRKALYESDTNENEIKLAIQNGAIYIPEDYNELKYNELKSLIHLSILLLGYNCDLNWIVVSNIKSFIGLFSPPNHIFNGDISRWNVGKGQTFWNMFAYSQFNGDISQWDMSSAEDLAGMFEHSQFNQSINGWNVSNVKNMGYMFTGAEFNQPLNDWDVSNVENMKEIFKDSQFNQPLDKWDVSNVKTFNEAFFNSSFNQNINNWNIQKAIYNENVKDMFGGACLIEKKNKPFYHE